MRKQSIKQVEDQHNLKVLSKQQLVKLKGGVNVEIIITDDVE